MDTYRVTVTIRGSDETHSISFLQFYDAWNWIQTQTGRIKRGSWTIVPWVKDIPEEPFQTEASYADVLNTVRRLLQKSGETRPVPVALSRIWTFSITGVRLHGSYKTI